MLVAGGGPAGAAAARMLALAGHSVMLADAAKPVDRVGESLPGAARPLLRDMGLLPWVERSMPRAHVGNASAWNADVLVATDFIDDPNGAGWHLDRRRFDQCLRDAAINAGAGLREARLQTVESCQGGWRVRLDEGDVFARWLIDASGRRAILAQRLGVERRCDESLVALYAWCDDASADARTLIEAVPHGWWYSAPLPGARRVAVLHVEAAEGARVLRNPQGWHEQLAATNQVRHVCPPDGAWTHPRGTDACGATLTQWYGDRWIAIGDAALSFDPLASQGMFNALYTGLRGAQAVSQALTGDSSPLHRYGEQLAQVRRTYRQRLGHYYRMEQRWANLPFWRSRHHSV